MNQPLERWREVAAHERGNQVDPQEAGLSGQDGGPKLTGRIIASAAETAECDHEKKYEASNHERDGRGRAGI